MGVHYDQTFSHTEDELIGSKLVPMRTVGFTTKPSGIRAQHRFDLRAIPIQSIPGALEVYAENLEVLNARRDVAGVLYMQDVNAVGQLIDAVFVVVQSTSGQSTEWAEYPLEDVVALGAGTTSGGKNPFTGLAEVSIPSIAAQLDALEGA